MIKINKHIEIVRSTKKGLGSMSQVSCDAIQAVLAKRYVSVGVTIVNAVSDLGALAINLPDVVFLGMKFVSDDELDSPYPAKIWLAEWLDAHGIAYTGSNQAAHQLEFDKPLAKQRVLDAGLASAAFYVVRRDRQPIEFDGLLEFPLFIKPTDRGGGTGIDSKSVAYTFDELQTKIQSIAAGPRADSLVEEYLPGREFSVALLQDTHSSELAVMPLELVALPDERGARLLSARIKSSNSERVLEVTDEFIKSRVSTLAVEAFRALGARDYGRIDIRLDASGVPHFLEANLIPSLISGYGSFPKACVLNMQLGYEQMILAITDLALTRSSRETDYVNEPAMTGFALDYLAVP